MFQQKQGHCANQASWNSSVVTGGSSVAAPRQIEGLVPGMGGGWRAARAAGGLDDAVGAPLLSFCGKLHSQQCLSEDDVRQLQICSVILGVKEGRGPSILAQVKQPGDGSTSDYLCLYTEGLKKL